MPEIRFDLLTLLAQRMSKLTPKQVDMDTVWREGSCGTVGCAMGWATLMPEFQDLGLRWSDQGVMNLIRCDQPGGRMYGLNTIVEELFNLDPVSDSFGYYEADDLFGQVGSSKYDEYEGSPAESKCDWDWDRGGVESHCDNHIDLFLFRVRAFFSEHGQELVL